MTRCVTIVDTSVLVEWLGVPGMCAERERWTAELRTRMGRLDVLVLPLIVLVETGNHIGQNGTSPEREAIAKKLAVLVTQALDGKGPFVFPDVDKAKVRAWLEAFPMHVARDDKKGKGSGLGDLAILEEVRRFRETHRDRKIEVLTKDDALRRHAEDVADRRR